jgi:hypothetical protein
MKHNTLIHSLLQNPSSVSGCRSIKTDRSIYISTMSVVFSGGHDHRALLHTARRGGDAVRGPGGDALRAAAGEGEAEGEGDAATGKSGGRRARWCPPAGRCSRPPWFPKTNTATAG